MFFEFITIAQKMILFFVVVIPIESQVICFFVIRKQFSYSLAAQTYTYTSFQMVDFNEKSQLFCAFYCILDGQMLIVLLTKTQTYQIVMLSLVI